MTIVSDLFNLEYGHSLELNALEQSGNLDAVNFVGRAARKNGVTARVKPIEGLAPASAGTLTVALGGQGGAGVTFLQPFPYYCGRDVMILKPKKAMTDQQKLWWATCISANRFRFGFGRQANRSLAKLVLPSACSIPNWVNGINLHQFDGAAAPASDASPATLSTDAWAEFQYDKLFEIKKGQRLTQAAMTIGDTPFIGSIDRNNGYRQHVAASANHLGNTITVNYNGSVAEAFYQPEPFWASDDVNVLYPQFDLNPYRAMFICALIRREKFRFNYGRKWHLERMNEAIIKLPITKLGEPDWAFMEVYIKALPYSSSIQRLV